MLFEDAERLVDSYEDNSDGENAVGDLVYDLRHLENRMSEYITEIKRMSGSFEDQVDEIVSRLEGEMEDFENAVNEVDMYA